MEGSLTERKLKKEDDFFFGSLADRGDRYADVAGLSEAPSKLKGPRELPGDWNDLGDPRKEDTEGDVAAVEMLAVDEWVPTVTMELPPIEVLDGQLRYVSLGICG